MATESVGGITVEMMVNSKGAVDGMRAVASASGVADEKVDKLVKTSLPQLQQGLTKTANTSGQAKQTLLSMTQVIQDAPYGIRGVANNIEFLTQSFTGLIASSGGTGNALKAVMASFTGPMGILFIVSAASSLLTVLAEKFRVAGKEGEEGLGKVNLALEKTVRLFKEYDEMLGKREKEIAGFSERRITSEINQRVKNIQAIEDRLRHIDQERVKAQSRGYTTDYWDTQKQLLEGQMKNEESLLEKLAEERRLRIVVAETSEKSILSLKSIAQVNDAITALEHAKERATGKQLEHYNQLLEVAKKQKSELESSGVTDPKEAQRVFEEQSKLAVEGRKQAIKDREERWKLDRELTQKSISNKYEAERNEARQWAEAKKDDIIRLYEDEADRKEELARLQIALDTRIAGINKKEQDDLDKQKKRASQEQLRDLDEFISGVDRLGNALHRALGESGDEFIQKMLSALKIAAQIARTMKKSGDDGMDAGDVISTIADIASFIALFDEGGYTGAGARTQPAGVVHRGEIVFEKPIVDKHKDALLGLRSTLQRQSSLPGYAGGGLVGGSPMMISNDGVVAELRMVRRAISDLEIRQDIILQGTLAGQSFLKKEMPGYERYRGDKEA